MKKIGLLSCIFVLSTIIAGCAPNLSPNAYNATEVGIPSRVEKGVIISKRVVDIDNTSAVGGPAGVVAGAAGGSLIGRNTATNIVSGVGGALIGGVIGNAIDKSIHHQQGFEYIIKLAEGPTISVVQNKDVQFDINQHVLIIYGAMTRIVPDETVG